MKFIVKKQGAILVPCFNSDSENLKACKLKEGKEYEVEIKQKRNYEHHKKYFALLNLCFDNQEHFELFDDLREYITIKAGFNRKVVMPNLLGRSAVQAEAVLQAKGLHLGKVRVAYSSELEPGVILAQTLLPGEEVGVGSSVGVTVSGTDEAARLLEIMEDGEDEKEKPLDRARGKEQEGGFKLWW